MLPADATLRPIARELYASVRDLPIISPHGHVPPVWLADDVPFADPTSLLITPDHYVNRMLHSHGVSLADLGVAQADFTPEQSRNAFRILCSHWSDYRGTPVRFWLESELADIFGIDLAPSADTADQIYDSIAAALVTPAFKPRALFERFKISFLATTDDPCDNLEHHAKLAADASWHGTVVPTFRPDKYLEPARPDWTELVDNLAAVSGIATDTYAGGPQAGAAQRLALAARLRGHHRRTRNRRGCHRR
ncbi:Glucuronate isomerase [Propioniciclava tarda]|nr:Glucuronate isomerase [Propioniciclava tarda]